MSTEQGALLRKALFELRSSKKLSDPEARIYAQAAVGLIRGSEYEEDDGERRKMLEAAIVCIDVAQLLLRDRSDQEGRLRRVH